MKKSSKQLHKQAITGPLLLQLAQDQKLSNAKFKRKQSRAYHKGLTRADVDGLAGEVYVVGATLNGEQLLC